MRKLPWEVTLFFGVIFSFIAVVLVKNYFNNTVLPELKNRIEISIAEKTQARVRIDMLDITPQFPKIFPLALLIQGVQIERDFEYSFKVKKIEGFLKLGAPPFSLTNWKPDLKIEISEAEINYDLERAKNPTQTGSAAPVAMPTTLRDFNPSIKRIEDLTMNLEIKNLKLRLTKNQKLFLQLEQVHVLSSVTSLDQPVFLSFTTQLLANNPIVPFWIPVSIQSQLNWQNSALQIQSADINILGLTSRSRGEINLSNNKIMLDSRIQAKDLSQIPLALKDFPIRKWAGAIDLGISVNGTIQAPMIRGAIALSKANLDLAINQPPLRASGRATGDVSANFIWNGELKVPALSWNVDLQEAEFKYADLFHKPSNYALNSSGKLILDHELQFENLKAQLGGMSIQLSGVYRRANESDLNLNIPITNLSGMEKLFLPIARNPLSGRLALQASLKGRIEDKNQIRIEIPHIKLENISSTFEFKNDSFSLDGPMKLNLNGSLSAEGSNLLSGGFDLDGDFSGLQVQFKDFFKKSRGDLAKINLKATKQGSKFQLRNSQLQTFAGNFDFSGEPPLHPTADFHMVIESKSLDLTKMMSWFPKYEKTLPKTWLRTKIEVSGAMNHDDFMNSPIQTFANFEIKIPQMLLPKIIESEKPKTTDREAAPTKAYLDNKPLIKGLNVSAKFDIGEFVMQPYEAQGITLHTDLKNLQLTARGNIQKLFGGSAEIKSLMVPLDKALPEIKFAVNASSIRIEKVTATMIPQFEKLIQAQAKAEVIGTSPWPTSKNFLPGIDVSGKFQLNNGVLNTIELTNMLKDVIAKIPQAKSEVITQRGPLQITEGFANFKMQSGKIQFDPFDAKTARRDELNVSGSLDLMMSLDLKGKLALADGVQNLGPIYEANKDDQGRLVIPLEIKGNALRPEMKVAQEIIGKMLAKTVEYEKNKAVVSTKHQITNAIDKKKSELEKDVKKKLESLFR